MLMRCQVQLGLSTITNNKICLYYYCRIKMVTSEMEISYLKLRKVTQSKPVNVNSDSKVNDDGLSEASNMGDKGIH